MAIYTSKFTQQEIDDGIDNANSAVQPEALDNYYDKDATDDFLGEKQDTLVSGANIKTINSQSVLGSGNIEIDLSGKTDKLPMTGEHAAIENNFVAIDAQGNIKDSGRSANDIQPFASIQTCRDIITELT